MTHYLLTPGPLTTTDATRRAMLRDWGSRDRDFIALTARVRDRLCRLAGAEGTHSCVLLQGSGTFVIEAALQSLVPRDGRLLLLVNGAYGRRMVEIARRLGRAVAVIECDEDRTIDPDATAAFLDRNSDIADVAVVHCETTSGIANPLNTVAEVVAKRGRRLIVDAMSSFGAIPIDARMTPFAALIASSNKGLEGVPGIGLVIAQRAVLAGAAGNAISVSLDLHAQWRGFETDGQWRFTPPTQVLAALDAALDQLDDEDGVRGRGARYRRNCNALLDGMRALGFVPLLAPEDQAPIIVTFHRPPRLDFAQFYDQMFQRGFSIYPGKLSRVDTFRIGCIGALDERVMRQAVAAVADSVAAMGLSAAELAGA